MKLFLLALLATAITAYADGRVLTTIGGERFLDATVTKKTSTSLEIKHRKGVAQIAFTELPVKFQKEFGRDPSAEVSAPASATPVPRSKPEISFTKWESELKELKNEASKTRDAKLDRRIIVLEDKLSTAKDFITRVPENVPAESVQPMVDALFEGKPLIGMPMLLANLVWGEPAHIYNTKTPNGLFEQWIYDKKNGRTPMLYLRNEVVSIICE